MGSGIRRAIAEWKDIDFVDDRQGCTFTVIVRRNLKVQKSGADEPINEPLTDIQVQILELLETDPTISYQQLAKAINKGRSTIMRQMQVLKDIKLLKRVGSKKSGRWEVKKIWPKKIEPKK